MGDTLLPQVMINGVTLGTNYVLMALGFTMIFGVLRIVNFAHGEFYMLGAFFVLTAIVKFQVSYFLAVVIRGHFGRGVGVPGRKSDLP